MVDCERPVIFGEVLYDCFPGGQAILGGAPFNVAWHLQGFGLTPLFISRVGDDPLGHRVRDAMHTHGMDTSGLQLDSSHPTGKVTITLSGNSHSFEIIPDQAYDYIDRGALPPLPESALFYHGSLAARSPVSAQALAFLRTRYAARCLVDVNLRSPWWQRERVLDLVDGAWLVKLNDEELQQLVPDGEDNATRMQRLIRNAGLQVLILTRGAGGAELLTAGGDSFRVVPDAVAGVVDTVGAGDALTSVLILAVLQGWPYRQALERSQDFASAIVGRRGAVVEDPDFYRPFIDAWGLS
ncbi:MAG: carbohydrate kinase [Gammaproteobacteria bacterium]|nr:carbohydrate kinase [Gammaproteobacteria bacterium]